MIRSLKKALQPSVTNIKLDFAVPVGVKVQQAPISIPPVFDGERVTLFGLLSYESTAISTEQCSATLTGQMLGEKVKHVLDFELPAVNSPAALSPLLETSGDNFQNILHCLAAKKLVQDWQDGNGNRDGWNKEEKRAAILKLSLDSGVVSSYTSFIAVDESQEQVIEGALQVWDLSATTIEVEEDESCYSISSSYLSFGGDNDVMDDSDDEVLELEFDGNLNARPVSLCIATTTAETEQDRQFFDSPQDPSSVPKVSSSTAASTLGQLPIPQTDKYALLSKLLSLQMAEGYWELTEELACIIEAPLHDLTSQCPAKCPVSVWGTVLALKCLETRFAAEKDEWELVAMKSELWMSSVCGGGDPVVRLAQDAAANIIKC